MAASVLIRADASQAVGLGHVMRCIALAQELSASGSVVRFAVETLTPFTRERLLSEGFEVREFGRVPLREITADLRPDWTVVDLGTGLSPTDLCGVNSRVLVIDDIGQRFLSPPDLVLNQNLHAKATRYDGVPEEHVLRGPRYVLFRNEFLRTVGTRDELRDREGVLLVLGGTDPLGLLPTFTRSIAAEIDEPLVVLAASSHPDIGDLRRIARTTSTVRLVEDEQNAAQVMLRVRLAVTAGGSTVWELAALGVPAVVGAVAPMEEMTLDGLASVGLFELVGSYRDIGSTEVAQLVRRRLGDPGWLEENARMAKRLIDSNGRRRVVQVMESLP